MRKQNEKRMCEKRWKKKIIDVRVKVNEIGRKTRENIGSKMKERMKKIERKKK